jgi:hypothetical protein
MVEFNKKVIVTANMWNLKDKDFMQEAKDKTKAQVNNPTFVPGINPAAIDVETKISANDVILGKRDAAQALAQSLTADFNKGRRELNDIMVSWAAQIQDAVGGDIAKIKALKFGVKNEEGEHTPEISITNSKPVISSIDLNLSMHHTVHFVNSLSETNMLPADVDCIEVYETSDESFVGNLLKMSHLGKAKRGKFVNHFTIDEEGKTVWYVAVYVPRKGDFQGAVSVGMKAKVV